MYFFYALIGVVVLAALGYAGGSFTGLRMLFGVFVPYAAVAVFLTGIAYRIFSWARAPVPFRITTTCGQQKSLPWIKSSWLESPYTALGTAGRMALEILMFRSLFRNSKVELRDGPKLAFGESKFLWLGALAFHWSFLYVLLRHLRFFMEPVPAFVIAMDGLDGFFKIGAPALYITDLVLLAAVAFLLLRRMFQAQVRYISLFTDYFALFLILGLALSGVWMRYFTRANLVEIKQLAIGLVTLSPVVPAGVSPMFFMHLFLLSALVAYFPYSKLVHMGGVFLSPTRNLPNNNRMRRHVNPWNSPVAIHTYEEWEEEFRDKIIACGLPLERQ